MTSRYTQPLSRSKSVLGVDGNTNNEDFYQTSRQNDETTMTSGYFQARKKTIFSRLPFPITNHQIFSMHLQIDDYLLIYSIEELLQRNVLLQ